jgi:hypothetical protein
MTRAETPRRVRVRRVIEVVALRGEGTQEDPAREVTQYYSLKGELLAESDSITTSLKTFSISFPAAIGLCGECDLPMSAPSPGCAFEALHGTKPIREDLKGGSGVDPGPQGT